MATTEKRGAQAIRDSKKDRQASTRNTNVQSTRISVGAPHASTRQVIKSNLKGPYNA